MVHGRFPQYIPVRGDGLSTGEYLEGAAFLSATLAGCVVAAVCLHRRHLADLRGGERAVGFALLLSATTCLAAFVPGALGILSRTSVLACALLIGAAGWWLGNRSEPQPARPSPALDAPPSARWSWALAGAGVGATVVVGVGFLYARSATAVEGIDALSFHLPRVARWIEVGTFWDAHELQPDLTTGTYPHTGNLTTLLAVLPWDSTWAARYVGVPFLALTALATYALARELRSPAATAVLVAAAVTAMGAAHQPAIDDAQVDPQMFGWFGGGAVFLLRHHRSGRDRDLLLAGLGLGLAFGTKWYALPYVPAVIGVWAVALGLARRRLPVRPVGLVAGATLLVGGFWLLRNWVEYGNPVYPTPVRLGPLTVFDAPVNTVLEQAGFAITDYLTDAAIWRDYLVPAFDRTFGWTGPVLGAGAVLATVTAVRLRDGRVLALAAASALIVAIYANIPYSAFGGEDAPVLAAGNTRWMVPGLMGAAALTAWVAGRAGRYRVVLEIAVLLGLLHSLGRGYGGLTAVVVARGFVLAGVLVAVVLVARALIRARPRPGAVAVAAASAVMLVAVGALLERRAPDPPYADGDAALSWIVRNMPSGAHVALGGGWSPNGLAPILPSFGPRLGNRVSYLGTKVEGTLRRYRRRASFEAALRRGRYDALVIGRGFAPRPPDEVPELAWARAAGYVAVATSPRFVLLRRAA